MLIMKNKKLFLIQIIIFLILIVLSFSPLVIPMHEYNPWFLGMPRTIWSGILISLLLIALVSWTSRTMTITMPKSKTKKAKDES